MKLAAAAIVCASLLTPGTGTPAPGDDRDARTLIEAAQQAMTAEQFQEAMDLYGRAGELMPDAAEIPFNMGVAAYRAGALERASELFDHARALAADPAMQARAAYNLGTTAARQARQSRMDDPAVAQTQMADATESLKTALDRFRDTIAMNPGDEDARANGELAWRWLKQLEQLQEQMQQEGGQSQEGDQEQDQDQGQDQQQQGEGQQQGEQGEQDQQQGEQPQQQEQQQEQEHEQDQQQGGAEEQEQQQEQEPPPSPGEAQQEQEQQGQGRQSPDEKPMTREEAERLLQGVRDKEAQRRKELARQQAGSADVDKDW